MASTDDLPITSLIPESSRHPILLYDQHAALRLALIEREGVSFLPPAWEAAGVYLLLYPTDTDGTFPVYVGKAPAGLRSRVLNHAVNKDRWIRALLVVRDTSFGFNSAQVGWLEGRLWTLAHASARGKLVNGNQPKDETLAPYERAALEPAILPIQRILRLIGYSLEPEDEEAGPKAIRRAQHGVTVQDLMQAGDVAAGAQIHFTWPGYDASAVIVASGQIELDGKLYSSLSAAGQAVRGGATNGWAHWAIRNSNGNDVSMAEIRAQHLARGTVAGREGGDSSAGPAQA